jgi:hypothetical protein
MKDIVERYNGARVLPAPKQMLADAIAEVIRLRSRIAELEAENAKLKEYREMLGEQLQKEIMQTISLQAALHRAALKGEKL